MSRETFLIRNEVLRQRVVGIIGRLPLVDKEGRNFRVVIERELTDFGRSKKRRWHAYVNLLADYKEVPAEAMKATLKAHLCPLVDSTDLITGEVTWRPKSIAELSDEEAATICEKTVQLVGEQWKLPLPSSDEEWTICKRGGIEGLMEHHAAILRQRGEEQ